MALSPADFYAYSRATGAPIPEDPQERADMAPEVLEFRRNQLKAPQQESNPLNAIGAAALGLGALAGLGFGARRLMRREPTIPQGPRKSATAGVRQVDLADMEQAVRRAATESSVPASKVPPSTERQRVYEAVAAKSEADLPRVYRPKGGLEDVIPQERANELDVLIANPRTGEMFMRGRSPQGFAENYISLRPELTGQRTDLPVGRTPGTFKEFSEDISLTDLQQAQRLANTDQFINAVESGEDQTTGRVIKQINIADPWGQATVAPDVVNNQQPVPALPATAASPLEQAQQFLQSKFEELGDIIPGRYRRERAMGQDPAIAEAMELYASTGDPSVLSRLSETPSSPLAISPRVQMEVKQDSIPTGKFYQVTPYGESVNTLVGQDIDLTNRISSLGEQKQNIINRLEEIDELEPQLRFAAADEPERGGYYTSMLNKMLFEKQSLPDPDSLNADISDALVERSLVRAHQESLESLGPKYKMLNRQEGVRPFFEVDPVTGEPIAETLEIRSGRPAVELDEPKTGGGRRYAMYDPESQTGSTIGLYGIEKTSNRAAETTRPTQMTMRELVQEGLEQATTSPEDQVPIPPSLKQLTERTPTSSARSSINMSQAVLKAAKQQATRNPRGGVLPDEITMLRRQMAQPVSTEAIEFGPRPTVTPGSVPPQQLGIKGVTGYAARRVDSPADIATNQLEAYLSKLQRGRSTPLTSEAVIQPRLF